MANPTSLCWRYLLPCVGFLSHGTLEIHSGSRSFCRTALGRRSVSLTDESHLRRVGRSTLATNALILHKCILVSKRHYTGQIGEQTV